MPKILPALPVEGVLDLGPVLIPVKRSGQPEYGVLLAAADRLGADAFVLENRDLRDIYGVRTVVVQEVLDRYRGPPVVITHYVYVGSAGSGASGSVYRAIRYVKGTLEPCDLYDSLLTEEQRAALADVPNAREQLRRLHVMFAQGVMDPEAYRKVRKYCVDDLAEQDAN